MATDDLGPSRYRIIAMTAKAIADLQAAFDKALADFTDQINGEVASLDATAATAQAAIESSVEDRTALHAALDALTARVTALEQAAQPSTT